MLYGCDASGRGVPEGSAEPTRGEMGVQRAGIDIGALRKLEVFLLVEALRLSELKRTLVMGGTT